MNESTTGITKVIVLSGPGGSGKTTIAKLLEQKLGFVRLDGDSADTEFFPNGGQWLEENIENLRKAHDKIVNLAKTAVEGGQNVVVDYIIFGDYANYFKKFKETFGDNLEIVILFPSFKETVQRDQDRECWTTGTERIRKVRSEFENLREEIGSENFVDTSNQTPEETFEKLRKSVRLPFGITKGKKELQFVKRFFEWIGLKERLDGRETKPPLVSEGDIWWISFGENIGQEVCGKHVLFSRPGIILKKLSHTLFLVVPTTTKPKQGTWFINIIHKGKEMWVCLHQIRVIDYRRLWDRIGQIDDSDFDRVHRTFMNLYEKMPRREGGVSRENPECSPMMNDLSKKVK